MGDTRRPAAHPGTPDFEVDSIARPALAVCVAVVADTWEHAPHRHRKGVLLYTTRGIIKCEVEADIWVVPPQCAIWIPGGHIHSATANGEIECYCLFVEPTATHGLRETCCALSVSPLLRELLLKAARFEPLYRADGPEARLVPVLLDELSSAPTENLRVPMPSDRRLRRLADLVLADPGNGATLSEWASRVGLSERSMSRLLARQIGMSFRRWRRQLHVVLALQRMTGGDSIQTVALDLGYESASSFVTMFRKTLGKPPARYMAERAS